ncbi:MAG: hypothetical protein AB1757_16670 [Acidobacteriota bacterium]
MFFEDESNFITVSLITTRYLGHIDIAERFFALLSRYGDIYVPEKWGTEERTRKIFSLTDTSEILNEWVISKNKFKYLVFRRKYPVEVQMCIRIEHFARATFNGFDAYIRDKYIDSEDKVNTLLNFIEELCSVFTIDYGYISHIKQKRRQSFVLTPAERLAGIYWVNLFGKPYIDFFGRGKLLNSPCYEVREIKEGLIILKTARTPLSPEILDDDSVAIHLKSYLNNNAFAGPNFPDQPCEVPEFDFSEVRWAEDTIANESIEDKSVWLKQELIAKGYKLISQENNKLIFKGNENFIHLDLNSGQVTLNMSGVSD